MTSASRKGTSPLRWKPPSIDTIFILNKFGILEARQLISRNEKSHLFLGGDSAVSSNEGWKVWSFPFEFEKPYLLSKGLKRF